MLDTDDLGSNPSTTTHINELISARLGRRALLGGTIAAGLGLFVGGRASANDSAADAPKAALPSKRKRGGLIGFAEVPPSDADTVVVPKGYIAEVLIPWGTPLFSHSPAYAEDASTSPAGQALQVGFNHDGMHLFPLSRDRAVLVVNHEYTDASQIYSAALGSTIANDVISREKVAKALAGHGVTVVEIVRDAKGSWTHVVDSPYNRRITGTTPMDFSGPVRADHPMLASSITRTPIGTLNNCANGFTPWGTYLTCEENWNGYFGAATGFVPNALEKRYGVSAAGFGYNWHVAEPRFDLAVNRNELNHFGWVVEIDPGNPTANPVKRTALGRIKHEGATCTESRGRLVVYTGDDENGDYLYKYVSAGSWKSMRARGRSPLDDGTLYVAHFDGEGGGEWLPLVHGEGALTTANGWLDQADVLIRTRLAADAVGATRLHRPEWVTVDPKGGDVYVTLTNGSGNSAPVNSNRDPNPYGHIIRLSPERGDATQATFTWDVFVLAGDSAYDDAVPRDQPVFGSPDGIGFDPDGRLWIQTDISNSSQNLASKGYDNIKNNQMLCADPTTGEIRRFLTGPRGCEITGITFSADQRTMFVNVQHPGESTNYWNTLAGGAPTVTEPARVSSWPSGNGRRPRPATLAIRKADGGIVGT